MTDTTNFIIQVRDTQKNTKDFIAYYKAANKAKLNRATFADILGIKSDSLRRRIFSIKREHGIPLPDLKLGSAQPLSITLVEKFRAAVKDVESKLSNPNDYITTVLNDNNQRKVGRYIITAAQNATPIHSDFFKSIMTYCDENDAKLLVVPYRYKNPTSIFTTVSQTDEWWSTELRPYLMEKTVKLCKELTLIGAVKIQPTATEPLSGFEGYTGTASAIFGHPKIQQTVVPAVSKELPKILVTTGAITEPNYTDSKSGYKGQFHHSLAALVVEVTDDEFHIRHIHYRNDGFYDLDKFYGSDGIVTTGCRVAALVTGDTHVSVIDDEVEVATYAAKDSICNVLKPEMKVYHDLLDFGSASHHHRHNDLITYVKHHSGTGNVEAELQATANLLDQYNVPGSYNVIVKSNHDEAFDRWLREADPKTDPENAKFYYYMKYNQLKHIKKADVGYESIDPFEFWCSNPDTQTGLKCVDNTVFLKRDQSLIVGGVELAFHGDKGPNGSRGSVKSFAKVSEKCIIGHSHSPGIYEGAYQVGTSSKLRLDYNSGPSSWMHTHAIVYQDGARTLINIVNGKWRA